MWFHGFSSMNLKPDEIPGSYDWQYLRETEAAFIETLAMQKGLYLGEALDTFYESRFALALEQGRERHALARAEMLAEYLEYSEPELFAKYECGCRFQSSMPEKNGTVNRRSVR